MTVLGVSADPFSPLSFFSFPLSSWTVNPHGVLIYGPCQPEVDQANDEKLSQKAI